MKMNIPVHCLEGILSPRVDEQQMHWLTEWITKLLLLLLLFLFHTAACKRTVVLEKSDSSPLALHWLSLFQPKTATIQHIAIALVKIYLVAG